MKYFIISGTSRGLGEAIAEQLIAPDHHLICISRNINDTLIAKSKNIDYIEFDLSNVDEIEFVIEKVFSKIDEQNAEGIYLINNAAVISPLCRIEQGSVKDFKNNLHVNLLAPMLLTSSFIRNSQHIRGEKRVLNVSSMSAKNHLPGMSVYSASKAGLDVFSQCVGVEQGKEASAVKVLSVWPGMMDTGLQEEARSAEKKTFTSAEIFKMVKDRGMLATPSIVAGKIIEILLGEQFTQGSVIEELFA